VDGGQGLMIGVGRVERGASLGWCDRVLTGEWGGGGRCGGGRGGGVSVTGGRSGER